MSEVYLARTNQKLSFAVIHIKALQGSHSSTSWNQHAEIESYNESVLFHLASAYSAFLREVAERYGFEPNQVNSIYDLDDLFEASGQESPERAELDALEADQGSWLHKLLDAYSACWRATDAPLKQVDKQTSVSEAHVMQLNPNHAEDADILAEYQSWLDELRTLVERLRPALVEL